VSVLSVTARAIVAKFYWGSSANVELRNHWGSSHVELRRALSRWVRVRTRFCADSAAGCSAASTSPSL